MTTNSTAMTCIRLATLGVLLGSTLCACGGGGGGESTSASSPAPIPPSPPPSSIEPTAPPGTTQTTQNYAADSAQFAIFNGINVYRRQCGFPELQQNTLLDRAAQNHAAYMIANASIITDYEELGKAGFTGVTGLDRSIALGWPSAIWVGGGNAGAIYTNATLTQAQYGTSMVDGWSSGVYHQSLIIAPASLIGIGIAQTTQGGFPAVLGGINVAHASATATRIADSTITPLTFPCQGISGVPYMGTNEIPKPPNATGPFGGWGTPVTVMGNPGDTVILTAATMTAGGNVTVLQILTSINDTTSFIARNQSVAYSSGALQPNTTYSVDLAGTINGKPFTRSFTFTTGNTIG